MREIKFRAWNGRAKQTAQYAAAIQMGDTQGTPSSVNVIVNGNNETWEVEHDKVELLQYTGLHDKNGVEVYDGDIVSFEDSDGGYEYRDVVINTGIVEYGELGFYFTNRVAVEMDDFYIKDGRCDGIEVIGNIYENPDLLEADK